MPILGIDTPSLQMPNFAGLGTSVLWALVGIVIMFSLAIFVWLYLDNRKYRYKIEIWESVGNGELTRTGIDKAKVLKLGSGGETILQLRRHGKKMVSAYGRKIARDTFAFAVGQDGYWYNFRLGDYDAKKGELDIEPIEPSQSRA